jgi:predicted GNAT superfamily acetyltransferase
MDPETIEIRPLAEPDEFQACVELQCETWGEGFSDVVPPSILKVSQRVGGVVLGAFTPAPDRRLVGFVFGLTGVERGHIVHWSDMLAVRPEARNIGVGRRLKEEQRKTVRELGGDVIYWTFDPLVGRNAHLNLNRLGGRISEYVVDMYGITDSALHGGVPTDRLIVAWPTRDEEIAERLSESERVLASLDCCQSPVVTSEWIAEVTGATILPHCVRVEIPADGETLLLTNPDEAARWRMSVREGMRWGLSSGYTVSAFLSSDGDPGERRGFYVLSRMARASSAGSR